MVISDIFAVSMPTASLKLLVEKVLGRQAIVYVVLTEGDSKVCWPKTAPFFFYIKMANCLYNLVEQPVALWNEPNLKWLMLTPGFLNCCIDKSAIKCSFCFEFERSLNIFWHFNRWVQGVCKTLLLCQIF